jgi:hypothetical protein
MDSIDYQLENVDINLQCPNKQTLEMINSLTNYLSM